MDHGLLPLFVAAAICLAPITPVRAQGADAAAVRSFTIEEAERLSLNNSAGLLSSEQDITIAQQRVQEAMFLFLPEVGLQASATRYDARYPFALPPELRSILLFPSQHDQIYSGRGYLLQTIYSGGRVLNLLHLAQTALKQAQSQYEAVKMDTSLGVRRVFYQLLLAQDSYEAATERLKAAQAFLPHGSSAGWERMEAEALISGLRAKQAELGHEVDLAGLEFRKQLNIELDTPVRVVGKLETQQVDVDLNKAIVWAMELRPELQAETYKARIDDIGVSLAQSRRNPTVFVESNYELTGQTFPIRQNNWEATVGLRIPFSFDFGAQIRQKRAEKRQGEIKRAETQDQVRLEVRQAYAHMSFWQNEWPQREREFVRLRTLTEAAPAGSKSLEPLRAQSALLDAQERFLTSVKEHLIARARLERAVGRTLTH